MCAVSLSRLPSMAKSVKDAGGTGSTASSLGLARGGAASMSAVPNASSAGVGPWASTSTSPTRLRTQPLSPCCFARR